uniref:Uncharacterized protein n=1 Tax=Candidatus Aschnera chinzeii TaxID=1485666 RepID=A0AAT9G4S9_9ENTR|nr:MAG: hypothetical protein ACHINZ_3860 [Candidatus Aschnera chinzeii]
MCHVIIYIIQSICYKYNLQHGYINLIINKNINLFNNKKLFKINKYYNVFKCEISPMVSINQPSNNFVCIS